MFTSIKLTKSIDTSDPYSDWVEYQLHRPSKFTGKLHMYKSWSMCKRKGTA